MKWDTRCLDGFRFILALWVALGHFYILIGAQKFLQIPVLTKFLLSPWVAVDGFIVITGFLMMYNSILRETKEPFNERSTALKFILRRVFRLYPVYLVAIVAAFLLVEDMYSIRSQVLEFFTGSTLTPFGTESKLETRSWLGLLTHLTFLHGFFPAYESSVLSVAWSLSLEMQFYVVFPLLFAAFFIRNRPALLLGFTAGAVILSEFLLRFYLNGQPAMLLFKLPLFLFGMLAAAAGMKKIGWRSFLIGSLMIIPFQAKFTILVIAILMAFLFFEGYRNRLGKLALPIQGIRKLLSSRAAAWGADISYSLYLIHLIVLPFLLQFFMSRSAAWGMDKMETAGVTLLVFLPLCFGISYLLHIVVEKPFIRMGKQVVGRIWSKPSKPVGGYPPPVLNPVPQQEVSG